MTPHLCRPCARDGALPGQGAVWNTLHRGSRLRSDNVTIFVVGDANVGCKHESSLSLGCARLARAGADRAGDISSASAVCTGPSVSV